MFPPVKPRFLLRAIVLTSGKWQRTYSAEPSCEPLSTKIVSKLGKVCRRRADKHTSRKCWPFQLTMMTLISGMAPLYWSRYNDRFIEGANSELPGKPVDNSQIHHFQAGPF